MNIPDDIDLIGYLHDIGEIESQDLHWASHWVEGAVERSKGNVSEIGACLPWSKTHPFVRLRPGEVSIWAGINGHRKSMITGQVALWLAKRQKVCIASLEMKPVATLERMYRQAAGCGNPAEGYIRKWFGWADENICLYDKLDTTPSDTILGMCYYAARELKCEHIFIDSLMKCRISGDDYNQQKNFVDRLALCAKTNNVHIHLIAHMRKGRDEYDKPGKFDISGSGDITNLVDNVFVCWKNKLRDEAVQAETNNLAMSDRHREALNEPDQYLTVDKQRHGEYEGAFKLWFQRDSLQFTGDTSGRSLPFPLPEFAA